MQYEQLPIDIRVVVPKNRFDMARQVDENTIRVKVNYDDRDWDTWKRINGRWQFQNKGS